MRKPYIKIQHIILEALSLVAVFISFIYVFVMMATVDGEIPVHYNLAGEVDGYGSPASILFLPIMMLAMIIMIIVIGHKVPPQKWNLPFKVRPEYEVVVYSDILLMLTLICLFTGLFTLVDILFFLNPMVSGLVISGIYVAALFVSVLVMTIIASRHNKGL